MERLEGVYCALWTPTDQNGEVLWGSFERHLGFVLKSGVHGIMALGSTGEFPHLTITQRKELLARIISGCKTHGRQVIANVSDVQIRNVIELARHAKKLGADCVSILPPWFFPLEQRDLVEFFLEVARQAEAALALYNFPEVTGKKIELETIERIAREAKVVALKQSGEDFNYHRDLLRVGQQFGFPVLSGADTRLEETLGLGCSGTVSGLANAIPEFLCEIFKNFKKGERSAKQTAFVAAVSREIQPLLFPLNVKAAIEARGFETGFPKMPISEKTNAIYRAVVASLTALFHEAGLSRN